MVHRGEPGHGTFDPSGEEVIDGLFFLGGGLTCVCLHVDATGVYVNGLAAGPLCMYVISSTNIDEFVDGSIAGTLIAHATTYLQSMVTLMVHRGTL